MIDPRLLIVHEEFKEESLALQELKDNFPRLKYWIIESETDFDRALVENQFNLVISDNKLNWTTGINILKRIKQNQPFCPVIMFSQRGNEEIAISAIKSGFDDYIVKSPDRYTHLAESVRNILHAPENQACLQVSHVQKHFFEKVKLGFYHLSNTGKIIEANSCLAEIIGYKDKLNILGLNLADYHIRSDDYRIWQEQLKFTNSTPIFEDQIVCLSGKLISVRHHATAIKNSNNQVSYYQGTLVNICSNQFTQFNSDQTLNCQKQDIQKVQNINKIRNEILSEICHQLRTPLSAIMGWIPLLLSGKLTALELNQGLEVIQRNAQVQNQLINEFERKKFHN